MNEGAQSLPLFPPTTAVSPRKEVTRLSEQESGHGYAAGPHQFCLCPTHSLSPALSVGQCALEQHQPLNFSIVHPGDYVLN